MNAKEFRYPQLVRVAWRNRRTNKTKHFVAGVVAQDMEHAWEIAEAITVCMIPYGAPLNVWYQTAELSRNPTQADMHAHTTPWASFHFERMNTPALKGIPAR